jgi:hypothetical protein
MSLDLSAPSRFSQILAAVREHGVEWSVRRAYYELHLRTGLHQVRFKQRQWAQHEATNWLGPRAPQTAGAFFETWLEHRPSFFFAPRQRPRYEGHLLQIMGEDGVTTVRQTADQIGNGVFPYFTASTGVLGFPPRWHSNGVTGVRSPSSVHWSRLPMWSERYGDMKYVWEPGRFSAAYTLARAFWVTQEDRYAETFWQLVESWYDQNPPNTGAHWKCGQETALRLMAWCFGLYAFADTPATTPQRLWTMVGAIAAQADRIEKDHFYSELQRNNHAISEGVGLWTVGLLFPWFVKARQWEARGREILERHARLQINQDGTFVQKSANYHRLMLQDYLYAVRVGESNERGFSPELHERLRRAADFMSMIHDPVSGGAPNLGGNDGALILPLNGCDYKDYRPICAAAQYVFNGRAASDPGPWLEDLLWLSGPEALAAGTAACRPPDLVAPEGGYYTTRGLESWALLRCGPQHDRPAHADMLHVDFWWRGQNIARDPGTYRYYDAEPWNNALAATDLHNTVTVDGLDQMVRGPRFLWSNWSNGRLHHNLRDRSGHIAYMEGEHDGYARLHPPVSHRRAILRLGEVWLVVDDLEGEGNHAYRLHWLLEDFPFSVDRRAGRIDLATFAGEFALTLRDSGTVPQLDILRGEESSAPRGWLSEYYGVRRPGVSVAAHVVGRSPVRFVTLLAPAEWSLADDGVHEIRAEGTRARLAVSLHAVGARAILARADYHSPDGDTFLELGVR